MSFPPRAILIIDDDRDIREALIETLEDEGYAAVGADGGAAALALLREAGPALPSLILLDLRMVGMSGADFRREQLLDPALRTIPVLIVSADASAAASQVPADGHLRKPLRVAELLAEVRRFVPSTR